MTFDAGTSAVGLGTSARKRSRWLLGLAIIAALVAAGAMVALSSSSEAVQARVKPLDRNVWLVRGRIDPDQQSFCARNISSIVPSDDGLYVICDSHGRLDASASRRSDRSP